MVKKISIFVLLMTSILLCSACDLINICDHEYVIINEIEASCSTEGLKEEECSKCGKKREESIPKISHTFTSNVISPTCTTSGYTLNTCSVCGEIEKINITDPAHKYSEWKIVINPSDVNDGLRQRKCEDCGYVDSEIILSTSYINLDVIKEEFDESIKYSINNYEELLLKFNAAILNRASRLECTINFDVTDFNVLLDDLINDRSVEFNFKLHASVVGNNLTMTFTHTAEPSNSTKETIAYTQYASLNYNPITKQRSDDFDGFAINDSLYQFKVSTTDQLCYALERGVLPIPETGSKAELIYNKIKEVLREIISDDMNDIEKAKAIHDYLIMNVVYDNDLLMMASNGVSNTNEYNGFYLEGVFLDNEAVCEGISKAFSAMCNIEGIKCVNVIGYATGNPDGLGHAWNKVYVNGNWYIVDVTSDGTIVNEAYEILSYKYFLIDEDTYSQKYTGRTFTNIVCNQKIDIYELSIYSGTLNLKIESQAELNKLVAFFNSGSGINYTLEFELAFDYGVSATDEIRQAFLVNGIYSSCPYIDNGDIFMLIRK